MARVTHVQKAQQRYETVPVLDEFGSQVETQVMRSDGTPKMTRAKPGRPARPVYMKQTVADKSKPKPLLRCDFSGCDINGGLIAIGTPYKHITPKSGPYGGTQKSRHAEHPNWKIWEYSYSRAAQVAQVQDSMHNELDAFEFTSHDDFDALRDSLAEQAQAAQDDAQEALDNMPEGLQDGSQAQENAEALENWVSEIESADAPDAPEQCEECNGEGHTEQEYRWFIVNADGSGRVNEDGDEGFETEVEAADEIARMVEDGEGVEDEFEAEEQPVTEDCEECDGTGDAPEQPAEEWIEEAKDVLREVIDESGL